MVVSGPNKKPSGGGGGRSTTSRRGVRSLAAAVTLSATLTALSFFFAGHSPKTAAPAPTTTTVALVRAGSVASEAVLALAAWMAWAEGGVHARPAATLLPYAAQLGGALAWAPLVLGHGAARAGLACCAAMAAAAVACARGFGAVNPVAGHARRNKSGIGLPQAARSASPPRCSSPTPSLPSCSTSPGLPPTRRALPPSKRRRRQTSIWPCPIDESCRCRCRATAAGAVRPEGTRGSLDGWSGSTPEPGLGQTEQRFRLRSAPLRPLCRPMYSCLPESRTGAAAANYRRRMAAEHV